MSQAIKSKVTYDYKHRHVLLLKEAFKKGPFDQFSRLLSSLPDDHTVTVVTSEDNTEQLYVNMPSKK